MRIAMLGWEFPPFMTGGLGVHCYYLSRALSSLGVEIDFYMPKTIDPISVSWMNVVQVEPGNKVRKGYGTYSGSFFKNRIPYSHDFFEAVGLYNYYASLTLQELNAERRYDLIHAHDWITFNAALHAKNLTSLPLVSTVHSTEYDRSANLYPLEWILDIERRGIRGSDQVITVSRMMKEQLASRFAVPEKKVNVIYNAIEKEKFGDGRGKELHNSREKVVLFHGRLAVQKGPDFFLKAAKLVLQKEPDTKFIISGRGGMVNQLIEESIGMGIAGSVQFTGFIPDEKLSELYSLADVYVLPSVSEPFGITVLEAIAAGTPAIVSKTSGVSETLNNCLVVDFWDVEEMANKIIALLRYGELKKQLREGMSSEVGKFTWEGAALRTKMVYGKCLHGS